MESNEYVTDDYVITSDETNHDASSGDIVASRSRYIPSEEPTIDREDSQVVSASHKRFTWNCSAQSKVSSVRASAWVHLDREKPRIFPWAGLWVGSRWIWPDYF